MNRGSRAGKVGTRQQGHTRQRGGPHKRKWIPDHKYYEGSVSEGQGFAFQRKTKVQHEYNKLLTKERKKKLPAKSQYTEEYPEHLRHLYMAESAKLKTQDLANTAKRSLSRMDAQSRSKTEVNDADTQPATSTEETPVSGVPDHGGDPKVDPEEPEAKETEREDSAAPAKPSLSVPMSNRLKRKLTRKTSFQIAQEEFQEVKEQRRQKNEEFLRNKQKKDEAIQKYKDKKKEKFQILRKKTKKGQPDLNLQMDYLLQKIQGPRK